MSGKKILTVIKYINILSSHMKCEQTNKQSHRFADLYELQESNVWKEVTIRLHQPLHLYWQQVIPTQYNIKWVPVCFHGVKA